MCEDLSHRSADDWMGRCMMIVRIACAIFSFFDL
jgi:hypothetical protein